MKFWMSTEGPAPVRKRKQITNALEEHAEYSQLKAVITHGRMRQNQEAYITMGTTDAQKLGYKWPWRAAVDSLRRYVKSMGLETDYTISKYETDTPGVWAIRVRYEPPMVKTAVPHAEATRGEAVAKRRGRRQTA
jgi:hypothetical protein